MLDAALLDRVRWCIPAILWGLALMVSAAPGHAQNDERTASGRSATERSADSGGDHIDAIPGAAQALDLSTCLTLAQDQNAALRAERARGAELDAQITQARAEGLPTLDAVGSWNRSRDPSFALDESFGGGSATEVDSALAGFGFVLDPEDIPAQTFWRASLNANWELRPTRVWNAVNAARLGLERQALNVEAVEHEVQAAVMDTYYRVILSYERLEAVEAELASRKEFLEISRRRLRVEMSTALDTLQAAVSLANLEPQRYRATQALRNTGAELNALLGRDALDPITIVRELAIETAPFDPGQLVHFVDHRPDVQQIGILEDALRKNRGAQKSLHRPYLTLDGSYGYVGRDLGTLTDTGHDFWSARVALTLPIFDGFLTRGLVKETEASIRRTRLEAIDVRQQARVEILNLAGDLQAARSTLQGAQLNETRAIDALGQMTRRYELGKAEYLDVLNAQFERFSARSNRIEATYEVLRLTALLKRALGMSPTRPLSTVEELTTP